MDIQNMSAEEKQRHNLLKDIGREPLNSALTASCYEFTRCPDIKNFEKMQYLMWAIQDLENESRNGSFGRIR